MKAHIQFLRSCGMKVRKLKELFGIPHSSYYEILKDRITKKLKMKLSLKELRRLHMSFLSVATEEFILPLKRRITVNKKSI